MPRPQKTTFDRLIDEFCEFTIEAQNRALELMSFEHRRARIRAAKQTARTEDLAAQTTATEALRTNSDVQSVYLSPDKSDAKLRQSSGQPVASLIDAMQEDT